MAMPPKNFHACKKEITMANTRSSVEITRQAAIHESPDFRRQNRPIQWRPAPRPTRVRSRNSACQTVNVGDTERWLSTAAGGALAAFGLSRGSLSGMAVAAIGGCLVYRGVSGHCELYHQLDVNTAESRGPMTSIPSGRGFKIEKTITINRPSRELFSEWRNLENLPKIMSHLECVKTEGNRSHWKAKAPLGITVEWDAEIINERPNELIAWRSVDCSTVDTAGSVHFRESPNGRETELQVVLKYDPPGGKVGAQFARWLGEAPELQIEEDLQSFKKKMESGRPSYAPM
jgi:uncharacterized membrane protein